MDVDAHVGEAADLEAGRATGPRWVSMQQESSRSQRVDRAMCICRRIAGLVIWGFVGFIFSQLWQVAWQLKDLKLMGVCSLVTAFLLYVFYKRFQQIRGTGLSGVELVRAFAVDDPGEPRSRGVTRKARSLCIDFKYDPEGVFRERSPGGRGFELYPLSSSGVQPGGSSGCTLTGWGEGGGRGGGEGREEEKKEEAQEGGKTSEGGRGRRRVGWPWGQRRGGEHDDAAPAQTGDLAVEYDEEATAPRRAGTSAQQQTPVGPPVGGPQGSGGGSERGGDSGRHPPPSAQQDFKASGGNIVEDGVEDGGGGRGGDVEGAGAGAGSGNRVGNVDQEGRQVIRASELALSCSVCLSEYDLNDDVTLLPCSHLYHTECIDIWMRDHVDCPYCRADMNVWCESGPVAAGHSAHQRIVEAPAAAAAAAPAAAIRSPAPTVSRAASEQEGST